MKATFLILSILALACNSKPKISNRAPLYQRTTILVWPQGGAPAVYPATRVIIDSSHIVMDSNTLIGTVKPYKDTIYVIEVKGDTMRRKDGSRVFDSLGRVKFNPSHQAELNKKYLLQDYNKSVF